MDKSVIKILVIFVIGMAGGIFADQIIWPFFDKNPKAPVYVTEEKKITNYIQENTALSEAVGKVEKTVFGVKTKTAAGEVLEGSGLIVTSDGMLVTLADLVPQGSAFYFYLDGQWPAYQILKRDLKNNLALIKIEDGGLSTAGFADLEKLKLGERVFLLGMDFSTSTPQKIINEGIVSFFDKDSIKTNIFDQKSISGSPLFDIEGNVVGLNVVGEDGRVSAIPVSQIKEFIGM
ncbi:MAG: serine protease [Candidatus Parcubacteria bacterium]|nr:serine protease [Candidatus Parcubacteria bacterium]